MSFLQREELLADPPMAEERYDGSFDLGGTAGSDSDGWSDDERMDVDGPGFRTLPPGEEGLLQSHAGGEAIFQQMWEKAKPGCVAVVSKYTVLIDIAGEGILVNAGIASRGKSTRGRVRCRRS
jgi:hypothetical protein